MEDEIFGSPVSRRTVIRGLAASPLLLLAATDASAAINLTGYWVFRVPNGDGTYRESYFELQQAGEAVTGKVMMGSRELPISNGTFKDGKLHFEVALRYRQQTRKVTYDGAVQGGRIALTMQFPSRRAVTGVAERTTLQATQPPARLPVPQLHDVPDNGLARTPPMGWNSWNKFAGRVADAVVRAAADAMVSSGMKAAGYTYINIDDTWQGDRDKHGNIRGNRKFPDMKALADYVHSKGLKIGIYSSPGPKTCAGYTGSYGHEEQDARTYAAWGFDYLKYDWCSAGQIYKNEDMRGVYQKMGDALLEVGRPIVFSLCQYGLEDVWAWGAKVGGNSWRTTGDIRDAWESMAGIAQKQFAIASYVRPGHWNDPDMLEIGNGGMTTTEYQTHMSLWALLRAPLLAGNDLHAMTDDTKAILMNHEVIAINQDRAAKAPKVASQAGETSVVARPLADGSTAVALINYGGQTAEASVEWESLGLHGKRLHARDLWKHENARVPAGRYTATVPSHGTVLLRVRAV
ncbi:MAG: glycoside hydrolase family 27 protein [Terriglobia bacterium]